MTPEQIMMVQNSFRKIMPIASTAAVFFYDHPFEIAPAVRSQFPQDLAAQKKLIVMPATAVNKLDRVGKVLPAVEELGRRRASYGVVDKYCEPMGTAPMRTLEQSLGTEFTPEVKAARTETYQVLAGAMQVAAAAVPA